MMKINRNKPKYPIVWQKGAVTVKVYCSIPNIATGILLKTGENISIIDPGDGILRDINKDLSIDQVLKISDIFITHGHHDHVGGVWSLLTYLRVMRKVTPVTIHYPAGCIEIETLFSAFCKVYSKGIPYKVTLHKIRSAARFSRNKIVILPFKVSHKERVPEKTTLRNVPALGFKFSFQGIKVCYGGDTAYCENLVRMAKKSDLAILEAGHEPDEFHEAMHMTLSEAKHIGNSAKEYFLVHVPE